MRLLELTVKGFRSLKDVSWTPGDLNVVIGPNGTGKSNLIRMLELISVSAQGRLSKYIQRMGGMEPLVWDGMSDSISFEFKASPLAKERDLERESLTYSVLMARLGKGSSYRIENELLANYYRVLKNNNSEPFKFLERQKLFARIFDENERALVAPEESVVEEETLLSMAAGPFTNNKYITQFQKEMQKWSVYHDLHVNHDAVIRQPTITRPEKRVTPDGQNLISVLHTLYTGDRSFKNAINMAMRAAFGNDFEELVFPPASDQRIQLRIRWKTLQREQSASDLSDGTLRFLFLLTVLASPEPAPVIAIDEPETGLHPSMFPIIAEHSLEATRRAQVIFTTHSPQFLDAFNNEKITTTVVKWENGETILKTLDDDSLKHWLNEYSLGTLFNSGELEDLL